DADADEKVARCAEPQSQGPAPSARKQAADRVPGRVERVERQELAGLAQLSLQGLELDARLDADDHVGLRVLEHAVEARGVQLDVAALRWIAHRARAAAPDR